MGSDHYQMMNNKRLRNDTCKLCIYENVKYACCNKQIMYGSQPSGCEISCAIHAETIVEVTIFGNSTTCIIYNFDKKHYKDRIIHKNEPPVCRKMLWRPTFCPKLATQYVASSTVVSAHVPMSPSIARSARLSPKVEL